MQDASSASMLKPMDLSDAAGPGKIAEDLSQPSELLTNGVGRGGCCAWRRARLGLVYVNADMM